MVISEHKFVSKYDREEWECQGDSISNVGYLNGTSIVDLADDTGFSCDANRVTMSPSVVWSVVWLECATAILLFVWWWSRLYALDQGLDIFGVTQQLIYGFNWDCRILVRALVNLVRMGAVRTSGRR